MPVFTFNAKDAAGKKISGERVAENKQVLQATLRRERLSEFTIKEKGKEFVMPTFGSGKVPVKDIDLLPPVLRDDRCRPAARSVS